MSTYVEHLAIVIQSTQDKAIELVHNLCSQRLQADGPVHVSLDISCRHRGHHVAAKQKAHLPLVSAGFALRLGSALDGVTKPLLLIALHARSVLCLTCSDACS